MLCVLLILDECADNAADDGWNNPCKAEGCEWEGRNADLHTCVCFEKCEHAYDESCERSALMYVVVCKLLGEEREEYEDYEDWVDELKNWSCERDDCGNTEVGNYTGHSSCCHKDCLVAYLTVCKFGSIFCKRGEKTDSCCETCCSNDEAEKHNAWLAENVLCDSNNELSLCKTFRINNRCCSAEVCKTAINESKADSSNEAGNTDHVSLFLCCLIALLLNGKEKTDGKNDTAKHIHCLVTGNDTFLDNRFNADNIADFTDWIYDTGNDENCESRNHKWGKNRADDVNNLALLYAKCEADEEEDDGASPGWDGWENWLNAKFECCSSCSWNSNEWTKADSICCEKDYRKFLADNFCDTFDALTCTCEHHKSKNCKTDVCQQEAKKCCEPLVGCIEAEIWWENKVTCAKEHGKQSKTHDENVFEMLFLVDHSLPLIIIVDFSCDS